MNETVCPECGCIIGQRRSRSIQDHRRLFALIRKAWINWPESERQLPDEKALRGYLLVMIGCYDVVFRPHSREDLRRTIASIDSLIARERRRTNYVEERAVAGGTEVLIPRSMNFDEMSRTEFNDVRDKLTEVIELTIGVSAQELLSTRVA